MLRSIALITLVLFASSCATLFAGNTKEIMVTSNPPGAYVTLNGQAAGVTPTRVTVDNHEKMVVGVQMQGYQPAGCYMNTSISFVWVVLDVIWALVPLLVDAVTGNWYELEGDVCTIHLIPVQAQVPAAYPPR